MDSTLTFFNNTLQLTHNNERVKLILKLLLFDLVVTLFFYITFNGGQGTAYLPEDVFKNIIENVLPMLPAMAVWIFFEELTARGPISFFIKRSISPWLKMCIIIVISLVFAFLHLPSLGFWEILVIIPPIFVGGITYSLVYIISGANQGKVILPLVIVFMIHLIWDIFAFALVGTP